MDAIDNEGNRLIWLGDLAGQAAGGKAQGLKQLMDWQLPCPNGFVILDANKPIPEAELADFYRQLGQSKVAVQYLILTLFYCFQFIAGYCSVIRG